MGPRRARRGEPAYDHDMSGLGQILQWGHGELAVENCAGLAGAGIAGEESSMGPRRARRGERPSRPTWRRRPATSMGPRRARRGERRIVINPPVRLSELQWGHGELAVENAPSWSIRP